MKAIKNGLILFFLLVGFVQAQVDLVEMKKKEEERRKKLPPSKALVTEENIKELFRNEKEGFSTFGREAGEYREAITTDSEKTAQEKEEVATDPEKTKGYWQQEIKKLKDRIAELKSILEDYQLQLNRMTTDFYLTSDNLTQNQIRANMDKMRSEIELARKELQKTEQQLSDLYEKARKKGIPPGWLRD